VTDRLKDGTERGKPEIKTCFKEINPSTNKAYETTNDNNLTNNIANTTYQIEDYNHGPTTMFIPDPFSAMDVQPCSFSQVQDNIDNESAITCGANEFLEQQNQQYLNPEINKQLTDTSNYTRHEEYIYQERSSTSVNNNFSPNSSDENNVTHHIVETEDAAATNTISDLHLTKIIPHFDPVTFFNDFEMDLGNKDVFSTKSYGYLKEDSITTMSTDPMWGSYSGSGPISAPHLRLARCRGSTEKAEGLKQRVRCG